MWLLTKNSISRDLLWVGTHARGLWGGNDICGVACSQGPYHHWPPFNQPGICCSQDLVTPHQPAAISWSPYSHHVPWTRDVRPVPPPFLCSDGSTSVLQSFLLLWGPAQQLSQLCLKGGSGTQGPRISPVHAPSFLNWCIIDKSQFPVYIIATRYLYTLWNDPHGKSLPSATVQSYCTIDYIPYSVHDIPMTYRWKLLPLNPLHLFYLLKVKFTDWKTQFKLSLYAMYTAHKQS